MSGYRALHRQHVADCPVWQVRMIASSDPAAASNNKRVTHTLSACGDGYIRVHRVKDKDIEDADELDASALTLVESHALIGNKNQVFPPATSSLSAGCSQISCVRNYVGEDQAAGDFIVASLEMTGRIRMWELSCKELATPSTSTDVKQIKATAEFLVVNATGTVMGMRKPYQEGSLLVAVACLDGTVQLIDTGIATPKAKKEQANPGGVNETLGSSGSAIVMSMCWHPVDNALIVGRKNGNIDVTTLSSRGGRRTRHHKMVHHGSPVRGLAVTPDGQLLVSGSDDGYLGVWDLNRNVPTLVHHVSHAHDSWILGITPLSDSRRFLTCGADRKLKVWNLGQIYAPVHTFHNDTDTAWTIASCHDVEDRLVSGSETGLLQVYSVE